LDLRVIMNTIVGASAGGINSVFLARAIAHDLNFDHLHHHWLVEEEEYLHKVSDLFARIKNRIIEL